ncbi:MAG: DinB family protein [Treponema sp.]|jgi:uncharacterized damage-inducible protein DinB|nr:DinB family protein [Treponema sp.]
MEKKYFELLAKYNRETNGEMNNIIKTLSEEEWNKEFTGFYKSIDEIIVNFVNEIMEIDLPKTITFVNYKGVTFKKGMDLMLIHMVNHETHHRGMVSLYLEMVGKANDYSGLYP